MAWLHLSRAIDDVGLLENCRPGISFCPCGNSGSFACRFRERLQTGMLSVWP